LGYSIDLSHVETDIPRQRDSLAIRISPQRTGEASARRATTFFCAFDKAIQVIYAHVAPDHAACPVESGPRVGSDRWPPARRIGAPTGELCRRRCHICTQSSVCGRAGPKRYPNPYDLTLGEAVFPPFVSLADLLDLKTYRFALLKSPSQVRSLNDRL
jgi:hypothetical protein